MDPSEALLRLARAQAGVVTAEQADALGFHRQQVRRVLSDGSWQRLLPGTCYTHDTDPPWLALSWAGVLRGGDEAVLCLDARSAPDRFRPRTDPNGSRPLDSYRAGQPRDIEDKN